MPRVRDMRVIARLVFIFLASLILTPPALAAEGAASQQAERQATQPLNNAPLWREVRSGERLVAEATGTYLGASPTQKAALKERYGWRPTGPAAALTDGPVQP